MRCSSGGFLLLPNPHPDGSKKRPKFNWRQEEKSSRTLESQETRRTVSATGNKKESPFVQIDDGSTFQACCHPEKNTVVLFAKISTCFVAGVVFGCALEKGRGKIDEKSICARNMSVLVGASLCCCDIYKQKLIFAFFFLVSVFEPEMIREQMVFRKFVMLKMFLSALATGAQFLPVVHWHQKSRNWTKMYDKNDTKNVINLIRRRKFLFCRTNMPGFPFSFAVHPETFLWSSGIIRAMLPRQRSVKQLSWTFYSWHRHDSRRSGKLLVSVSFFEFRGELLPCALWGFVQSTFVCFTAVSWYGVGTSWFFHKKLRLDFSFHNFQDSALSLPCTKLYETEKTVLNFQDTHFAVPCLVRYFTGSYSRWLPHLWSHHLHWKHERKNITWKKPQLFHCSKKLKLSTTDYFLAEFMKATGLATAELLSLQAWLSCWSWLFWNVASHGSLNFFCRFLSFLFFLRKSCNCYIFDWLHELTRHLNLLLKSTDQNGESVFQWVAWPPMITGKIYVSKMKPIMSTNSFII